MGLMMLVGASLGSPRDVQASEFGACRMSVVTGYSVQQYPGRTADGSSTGGSMAQGDYLAAGPAWMLGKRISVDTPWGEAVYRVADTGMLAQNGIDYDLLFATTGEALQWGRRSVWVCVE